MFGQWSCPVGRGLSKLHSYCPLLKRMQLTCTAWEDSLINREDRQGKKTCRSCQKHEFLSLQDFFINNTVRCFSGVKQAYS